MTNEEINRYIHVEIMGKCWHNVGTDVATYWCDKCKKATNGNPDYCSDDSPRSLLNEVMATLSPSGSCPPRLEGCFTNANDLPASAEFIARACVEAHKATK